MHVYVINKNGNPLMPCSPAKSKHLLQLGKAKVIRRTPFTIKLLWDCEENVQSVTAGMDTGSKTVGCAAVTNEKVVYQSETELRWDISKKMKRRAMYRRTRRSRLRYRKMRWSNRASMRKYGRLAPSIRSKIESHMREKKFVESILPVSEWKVETASFDIHQISNPNVVDYQNGDQKGFYNTKAYVLHRDGYKCQSGIKCKHSKKLHVHHIQFSSKHGTDTPSNLITLCADCHGALHRGEFELKTKGSKTKPATEMGIIKSQLKKIWDFFKLNFNGLNRITLQSNSISVLHTNAGTGKVLEACPSENVFLNALNNDYTCKRISDLLNARTSIDFNYSSSISDISHYFINGDNGNTRKYDIVFTQPQKLEYYKGIDITSVSKYSPIEYYPIRSLDFLTKGGYLCIFSHYRRFDILKNNKQLTDQADLVYEMANSERFDEYGCLIYKKK